MNIPKPKYEVHVDGAPYQIFDNVSSAIDYASRHLYISKEYGSIEDICDRIESGKTFTFSYGFKVGVIIPKDTQLMKLYKAAPEMLAVLKRLEVWLDDKNSSQMMQMFAKDVQKIIAKAEGKE